MAGRAARRKVACPLSDSLALEDRRSGIRRESPPIIQDVGTEHYLKDREVTKPRMKYLGISVAGA